jgi:hypothetical protein
MKIEEAFIRALRDKQAEFARESLSKPQARDAFEFGRVSGIYVGLALAMELFETILDGDEKEEDHGKSRRGVW